eukprot:gene16872-22891_t
MGLSPWDVAAGALLVTEAGGLIGNFTGEADFLEQKECMAANPKIYGQLVGITGKYSKFASAGEKATLRQARTLSTPAAEHLVKPGIEADMALRPKFIAEGDKGSGKLEGQVAIVTGGDSGIGRAVAVLYAREGADVAIFYLNEHEDA